MPFYTLWDPGRSAPKANRLSPDCRAGCPVRRVYPAVPCAVKPTLYQRTKQPHGR
jgi:hypothetical protein